MPDSAVYTDARNLHCIHYSESDDFFHSFFRTYARKEIRYADRLFSGLLMDMTCMVLGYYVIGFRAFIYMYIGFLSGYCYQIFYDDDVKMPVLLTAAGDLAYGLIVYIVQFLLRGRVDFFFYLKRIIVPEMIYTVLVTLVLYRVFLFLNKKIEKKAKRSVDSFV